METGSAPEKNAGDGSRGILRRLDLEAANQVQVGDTAPIGPARGSKSPA